MSQYIQRLKKIMNLQNFYSSSDTKFAENFLGAEIGQIKLNFGIVSVLIKFWKGLNIEIKVKYDI